MRCIIQRFRLFGKNLPLSQSGDIVLNFHVMRLSDVHLYDLYDQGDSDFCKNYPEELAASVEVAIEKSRIAAVSFECGTHVPKTIEKLRNLQMLSAENCVFDVSVHMPSSLQVFAAAGSKTLVNAEIFFQSDIKWLDLSGCQYMQIDLTKAKNLQRVYVGDLDSQNLERICRNIRSSVCGQVFEVLDMSKAKIPSITDLLGGSTAPKVLLMENCGLGDEEAEQLASLTSESKRFAENLKLLSLAGNPITRIDYPWQFNKKRVQTYKISNTPLAKILAASATADWTPYGYEWVRKIDTDFEIDPEFSDIPSRGVIDLSDTDLSLVAVKDFANNSMATLAI